MEVVHEPFGRRGDRPLVLDGLGQDAIRLEQDPAVVRDSRADRPPGTRLGGDRLGAGKRLTVLLQALDAEQLGRDRLREVGLVADWLANADLRSP